MSGKDVYENLKKLNIELPEAPEKAGVYEPMKLFGENLAYISGCGPAIEGLPDIIGKVGEDVSLEEGQEAARRCILNILAVLDRDLGDLNKVKDFVKMLAFVASSNDFYKQPQVVNAASKLLVDIFGEDKCPARSAIGVNVLPGDISVEIELLIELDS
ncbi:MAG: RidA family protein [Clostridiales bacterium]|nr:RidA family protein [Clostridiales bacterium]